MILQINAYHSVAIDGLSGITFDGDYATDDVLVSVAIDAEGYITHFMLSFDSQSDCTGVIITQNICVNMMITDYNQTEVVIPNDLDAYENRIDGDSPDNTEPVSERETEAPLTVVPSEQEAEQPTSIVPTEEAESQGVEMIQGFDAKARRRINIFLSNFSEQHFGSLDKTDRNALVFFAYMHNKINIPSSITADGGYYVINKDTVDQTLYRFFGFTIEHNTTAQFKYRNNAYYTPAADGEAFCYFTVATEMYDQGDGTYLVYFEVYALDVDVYFQYGITNEYYELSIADARSRSDVSYCYSGSAIVCDYDGGSFTSYQTIDYIVD